MAWILKNLIAIVCFVCICNGVFAEDAGCEIDVNKHLPENQPLIFAVTKKSGKSSYRFAFPEGSTGEIVLDNGEEILLACPGPKNELAELDGSEVTATCERGTKLTVGSEALNLGSLGCSKGVSSEARREGTCSNGATLVEIGFEVKNNWFSLVQSCFDENLASTLYSRHILYGTAIKGAEQESDRPTFQEGQFFDTISANNAYKQNEQIETLTDILGSDSLAKKYIQNKGGYYLARGHLAPDGDFIFASWQFLTYYYVNVAPQWQVFNAGNWLQLEKASRQYAGEHKADLDVITGTYDILTLPDNNGRQKEIYLHVGKNDKKIPVPKFFWKVLYNPKSREGVAFVGVNNPYIKSVQSQDVICKDICNQLNWVKWDTSDTSKGYMYCCSVNDLRKKVKFIPKLNVQGILD